MEQPSFNELFRKYIDNTCTPEEVDQLMALLEKDGRGIDREGLLRRQLLDGLEPAGYSDPVLQQQLENRLQTIVQHIDTAPRGRISRMAWTRIAAAILVIVALGGGALYWWGRPAQPLAAAHEAKPQQDIAPGGNKAVLTLAGGQQIVLDSAVNGVLAQQGNAAVRKKDGRLVYEASHSPLTTAPSLIYNTMTTPRGGQYQLTLPDGTQVWLNAASSIHYPIAFTGHERRVSITGEAYFEVKKNAAMPFIVNVNGREEVEVLGTHFNINAYDDEPSVNTTLLEGRIRLQSTILTPGQQAQYTNANEPVHVIGKADIEQVMAWKNNRFRFDSADLKKVMRQLARWYNVEVVYEKDAPVTEVFVGEMQRSLNLSQVLNGLGGMGVHFRIEGRKLVVMP